MYSNLGRHGDHGHRCHRTEHGESNSFDRSLAHEMRCGSCGGGRRRGSHSNYGRGGERFGCGREGRVRLDPPMHHRRSGPMSGRLLGGSGLGGGCLGGGLGGSLGGGGLCGGLGGGSMRRAPLEEFGSRGLPYLGWGLEDTFTDPRESQYLRQELGLGGMGGLGPHGRLGGGQAFVPGGMGMGLGLGGGPHPPSLRESNYSFDHLDRRPRPYHYQSPYVEDWEPTLEEELLREDIIELLEISDRRNAMKNGADLYGLPAWYDFEDLMGGTGGRMV